MSRIIDNPRELIMSHAKEILYNEGYSKLSIRNISKSCGIATGTIYNYYPTKQDLVMEMMSSYWEEYLFSSKELVNSKETFYIKLKIIFNNLNAFINTFRDIWLKPELYNNPGYIESGLIRKNAYMERLILIVEKIVQHEIESEKIDLNLSPYEMAKFIVLNLITIVQMPVFEYSSFEKILKEFIK